RSGAHRVPPIAEEAETAAEAVLRPTAGLASADPAEASPGAPVVRGRVRAAHLRVLSRILQHQIGESGVAKITAEPPERTHALAPPLAPLAWVELGDLIAALEEARKLMPGGLVPRKVGRGTMSATFARLFGADPASLAAETVIQAVPTFWARYHDWGDVAV